MSMSIYDKIFPPRLLTLPNGKQVSKPRSRAPLAAVILVAMTILSVEVTGFDMGVLVSRIKEFFVILGEMIPPEWDYMPQIWQPLFDTIKMSLLGSFIGSILVVPFAMLASTNIIHSRVVVAAMRLLLSIIRTLPTLVSALIATYIFGLGTLAGTTAIAIFTFAYIGKILYEEIETVDMGPFEAMEAMGATKVRSFISAIVPQVLPSYLSNCLFCFEGNVRYASILGYVGAGGLGVGVEVDRAALPGGHHPRHLLLVGRVHVLGGIAQGIAGEAGVRVHRVKDIGAGGVVVGEPGHIDEVTVGRDHQSVQPVLNFQICLVDLPGLQIVLQPVRIQVGLGGLSDLVGGAVVLVLQHGGELQVAHIADGGAQQHAQQQYTGDELYGEP